MQAHNNKNNIKLTAFVNSTPAICSGLTQTAPDHLIRRMTPGKKESSEQLQFHGLAAKFKVSSISHRKVAGLNVSKAFAERSTLFNARFSTNAAG